MDSNEESEISPLQVQPLELAQPTELPDANPEPTGSVSIQTTHSESPQIHSTLDSDSSKIPHVLVDDSRNTILQQESSDEAIRSGVERRLREWALLNHCLLVNEKRLCRICASHRQVADLASSLLFHFISLHSDTLREVLFPSISLAPPASTAAPPTQIGIDIDIIQKPIDDSEETWPPVRYVDIYEVPFPKDPKTAALLHESDAFVVCIQVDQKHLKRYRCGSFLFFSIPITYRFDLFSLFT